MPEIFIMLKMCIRMSFSFGIVPIVNTRVILVSISEVTARLEV